MPRTAKCGWRGAPSAGPAEVGLVGAVAGDAQVHDLQVTAPPLQVALPRVLGAHFVAVGEGVADGDDAQAARRRSAAVDPVAGRAGALRVRLVKPVRRAAASPDRPSELAIGFEVAPGRPGEPGPHGVGRRAVGQQHVPADHRHPVLGIGGGDEPQRQLEEHEGRRGLEQDEPAPPAPTGHASGHSTLISVVGRGLSHRMPLSGTAKSNRTRRSFARRPREMGL